MGGCSYFGGNVGIGTNRPQKALEIAAASAESGGGVLRLTGTGEASQNDVTGAIQFYNSDTTDYTPGVFGIIRGVAGPSGGEGHLQFLTDMPSEGADASTVAMQIHSNANIGIGTTAPGAKLSIVGDVSATGGLSAAAVTGASYFGGTVGIGTTAPSKTLEVNSGTANGVAQFTSTDPGANITLTDNTGSSTVETNAASMKISVDPDGAVASSDIRLQVDGSTKNVNRQLR